MAVSPPNCFDWTETEKFLVVFWFAFSKLPSSLKEAMLRLRLPAIRSMSALLRNEIFSVAA